MWCKRKNRTCETPSMCAPFQGCGDPKDDEIADLKRRVERLEQVCRELNPGTLI